MINGDDTFMSQTALLASSSGYVDEPVAIKKGKDSMLAVFVIVFALGTLFLL